ncbi:U3 small nucleolar RNA-associated protein NOL7 isoform X1 [Gasterosteus aculeatus]
MQGGGRVRSRSLSVTMRRSAMTLQNNMAKNQRGEAAPSSRMTGRERQMGGFSLLLESSDDEGPEEVTFEDSKADARRSMKRALDTARREKELLKEKRRKRQELFQEQKKRKLLSAEVLEEIDSTKQEQSHVKAAEEEAEPEEVEGRKRNWKQNAARNLKGNYTVTTVKQSTLASSQLKAAEDFLHSRMYGPGSRRTTSNEMLSLENKMGKNKSAAVQFVKKNWACQKKAKAEKLKKTWIHMQQIPSS